MRPTDNINQLIKKLHIKASADLDGRVHDDIDRALVGISADESARRVHYGEATVSYPLVDEWITRAGCGRIIEREGLDLPVKSGCFFFILSRIFSIPSVE